LEYSKTAIIDPLELTLLEQDLLKLSDKKLKAQVIKLKADQE